MASGKIITYLYPILVYLGIDLIDSSYLLYLSSENIYDTIEYILPIYKVKNLPCSCVACRGILKNFLMEKYSSEKTKFLCLHNLINAKNYMKKVIQYLNYEDFRSFVEKSSFNNTNLISMLRILDKQYFNVIKFEYPLTQKNKVINCLGAISYYRPDFQEFRERTIKNFEPESFTSLLILFPCSATKPYSVSKSHKQFLSVLRKFPQFPSFQEVILTSPLGAIPRQLEDIYPVNSYNIPVTGDWDEEEIKISSDMLFHLLQKYDKSIPIVAHLEEMYIEIVNRALKRLDRNCYFSELHNKITSKESLASLENNILKVKDLIKTSEFHSKDIDVSKTWNRKIIKILDYQFGIGSGLKILSKGFKIKIKKDQKTINIIDLKTNESLGNFFKSTGQIMLTIKGAQLLKRFSDLNSNVIVFNGEKINGNTLFRPGVLHYTADLIPGSNIIILDQERRDVIGVGNLLVGSNYIKNSSTGRIAKIYEHI
jgi:archaeosine synthase